MNQKDYKKIAEIIRKKIDWYRKQLGGDLSDTQCARYAEAIDLLIGTAKDLADLFEEEADTIFVCDCEEVTYTNYDASKEKCSICGKKYRKAKDFNRTQFLKDCGVNE